MYRNYSDLLTESKAVGGIARAVLQNEMALSECGEEEIYKKLAARWQVMRDSAERSLQKSHKMPGMLISGQAKKQALYAESGDTLCGNLINEAMALAFSCSEENASMGRVCAAPTAGSCGVIPAVITVTAKARGSSEREILDALLVASGIGAIITRNATVSGAAGGCQAECGAAAAMAAGAAVYLSGGDDGMIGNAVSMALMNCMGLICDPVAGLVQLPCSFRNASQAVNALLSADLALAGQDAVIPPDEAIDAMYKTGRLLPVTLRETAEGGIAATKTAKRIAKELLE